jgi:predicted AlkP superfamily pyrophosphatase or phosphodiesterase
MHVFLFLIDGMGANYITPQTTPMLSQYLRKQVIINSVPTITCPNWMSILSGVPPSKHRVIDNKDAYKKNFNFPFSTIFHDAKASLLISDWKRFKRYIDTDTMSFVFDAATGDMNNTVSLWLQHGMPELTVVNLQNLDTIGHKTAWGSKGFMKELRRLDSNFGRFMEQLHKMSPNEIAVCVTADHGGIGNDHEDPEIDEIRQVPFLTNFAPYPPIKTNTQVRKYIRRLLHLPVHIKKI